MKYYYITFRSVTLAQRAEAVLRRANLACAMYRTPKSLSQRGCSYSLRVTDRDALAAVTLLRDEDVGFGKLYTISADGRAEELQI